jgi:hypothetical protein
VDNFVSKYLLAARNARHYKVFAILPNWKAKNKSFKINNLKNISAGKNFYAKIFHVAAHKKILCISRLPQTNKACKSAGFQTSSFLLSIVCDPFVNTGISCACHLSRSTSGLKAV